MRILFVLPYFPSPIRVRPYHFIRSLAARHDIDVLATASNSEMDDIRTLRAICRKVESVPLRRLASLRSCAAAALRGEPLQSAVCRSPELARNLSDLVANERYDLVHVEHLRVAHVGELLPPVTPTVYDSVDCISLLLERTLRASHCRRQRTIALIELHRTRVYETHLMRRFDRVTVTSPDDARALRDLAPTARISVIPNGVDLEHFQPLTGRREPATLVFSGKMSYHANVTAVLHFVQKILPLVRQRHPNVRLRIVGSGPPPVVQSLSRDQTITVTGRVPSMRDALGDATLAICPVTVKVGIQNKILEAMALGIPVVCTQEGAEGLDARSGEEFLVGGSPAEFADHVCRLLDNPNLASRLGRAGREYVGIHHRWDSAAHQLESLYEETIGRQKSTLAGRRSRR